MSLKSSTALILKQFGNQHYESEKTEAQNSRWASCRGEVTKRPEVEQNDATVNEQTGDLLITTSLQQTTYAQASLKL